MKKSKRKQIKWIYYLAQYIQNTALSTYNTVKIYKLYLLISTKTSKSSMCFTYWKQHTTRPTITYHVLSGHVTSGYYIEQYVLIAFKHEYMSVVF